MKPVVVVEHSATSQLAQFLDKLLRPIFQRQMEHTTFKNGSDFMRKLIQYIDNDDKRDKQYQFHSKTIFTTITISNFFTLASHYTMQQILQDFFRDNLVAHVNDKISMNHIFQLTKLFLSNNHFYYNNTIYRYARGSPECLGLSETLSNIYIFQWQKLLLNKLSIGGELFGR